MSEPTIQWRSLAEAASVEMDSERLNALVEKLIQTLDAETMSRKAEHFPTTLAV
jgi:hypothetical protein